MNTKKRYIDILFKHQKAISVDKFDLGRASNFTHRIYLKDNELVYRKQFKIPEAHQSFIEATLDELLKLGVVKRTSRSTTHHFSVSLKNKAKVFRISGL